MNAQPLLKWTGHPLVDVGVATLCAMAGKDDPEKLTLEDLDVAGDEIKQAYTDSVFVSYLSCVYTMNAPYTNPKTGKAAREASLRRLLLPHRGPPDEGLSGLRCVFSGQPATHFMERSQMPMLTGAGVLNFFPAGLSELPVAAPYLLAIQTLALGGQRSEGKLLIVHCDDPQWTLHFARRYLERNRLIIDLSRDNRLPGDDDPENLLSREAPGGWNKDKKPKDTDAKAPESLVMDDLVEIVAERKRGKLASAYTSITMYLLSNSGQGPSLAIEHIPGAFIEFLYELHGSAHASRWERLVARTWQAGKRGGSEETEEGAGKTQKKRRKADKPAPLRGPGRSRNDLYNDLLPIFENGFTDWQAACRFIRRHFLSNPQKYFLKPHEMERRPPGINREQLDLIDWNMTALFLERALGMNKERIDLIQRFGSRLADLIRSDKVNGKRAFRDLVFTNREGPYRTALARLQLKAAQTGQVLPFSFNDYVNMFLMADGDEKVHWSLVRDLITIALVETLHRQKFFEDSENEELLDSEGMIEASAEEMDEDAEAAWS